MSKEIGYLSGDTFRFLFLLHSKKYTPYFGKSTVNCSKLEYFYGNKPNFRVKFDIFALDPSYEALGSKMSHPAHPDQSDPESKNGPNEFELDAELFWASGTQ